MNCGSDPALNLKVDKIAVAKTDITHITTNRIKLSCDTTIS